MKKILLFTSLLFFTQSILSQCYESLTFGGLHTIAQKADGTLWGWGQADAGQVMTTNNVEPLPIQMGVASDWDLIETGTQNTFGIKNDGTLWGCGRNTFGALGINSTTEINPTFQQVTTANDWVKVSASHFFALALKSDGTIWAWGQNDYYQLGNAPATATELSPLQVGTDTDWVEISAGTSKASFAIKSDGTIWGWGKNNSSIIVTGSGTTSVAIPTQIGTDTDWNTMSVGGNHILAQKSDSTLWSWGGGAARGLGNVPTSNTPQQISTDKWISYTAGDGGKSFGVKPDGTLWAWGNNTNGQLGDGTTTVRYVPTQIGTDNNWSTVQSGGGSFITMATKTDGSVWYWGGTNYYGTYGNGSSYGSTYIMTPTQTQGICVTPVSTGPTYNTTSIGAVNNIDANGEGTSVGDSVRLTGVVHCQNYRSPGYEIVLIDGNNDGITLFSPTDIGGYVPAEGDEIEVEGEITQFNGLLQIKADNITLLQQGAALQSPTISSVLDESTESQFIKLENLELVNGETMWPTNGNIEVSNQVDTFLVRVPAASTLAGTPTPGTYFHLIGIGKQDDASSPYDEGYQIYPCGVDPYCDIDISTTLNNETISVVDTGHSYQWIDCADSSVITGETGEAFTPTANGDYAVIITQGPCVDTSACVFVDVLGVEDEELAKHFVIQPNPAQNKTTVHYSLSSTEGDLEVYDLSGRSIAQQNLSEAKGEITLHTSTYQAGVYIVVVRQSNGYTLQQKLVIE